jgi:hypothetical protein
MTQAISRHTFGLIQRREDAGDVSSSSNHRTRQYAETSGEGIQLMMNTPTQDSGTQEKDLKVTVKGLMFWAGISILLILAYALSAWGQGPWKVVSIFSHGALTAC